MPYDEPKTGSQSAPLDHATPDSLIASLEPDQLTAVKAHYSRREIGRGEWIILWLLRLYVLFMMGVVVYQVWTGTH